MGRLVMLVTLIGVASCLGCAGTGGGSRTGWSVSRRGSVHEIAYGSGTHFPQYAALHTDSSYFRMNYGPASGWGTSIVVMPSFWEGGVLHQGAPVEVNWSEEGGVLMGDFTGTISALRVSGRLRISPPSEDRIIASMEVNVSGSVTLDNRPGEAFKPVMLSSMHASPTMWDAQSAWCDTATFAIPSGQWIIQPPVIARSFGLRGGTSDWKVNAPTIAIELEDALPITGWVTPSNNPNDDSVALWCATEEVLRTWRYRITATP